MHLIAAKAVGFGEALRPSFAEYARAIIANAKVLAEVLVKGGYGLVSGGTDTHLILVDLREKGVTGSDSALSLERAGITCNKNGVPSDPAPPMVTSGIRLGVPAVTTRGMRGDESKVILLKQQHCCLLLFDILQKTRFLVFPKKFSPQYKESQVQSQSPHKAVNT